LPLGASGRSDKTQYGPIIPGVPGGRKQDLFLRVIREICGFTLIQTRTRGIPYGRYRQDRQKTGFFGRSRLVTNIYYLGIPTRYRPYMKYCPECGKPLANEAANFCDNCGAKLLAAPTITVKPPEAGAAGSHSSTAAPEPVTLVQPVEEKSTPIAAICSLIIPGLGQVYDGKLERGFLIFFGTVIGFFLFIIPGLCVWAFGIYDAYTIACKMNNKEIPFLPTKTAHLLLFIILALFTVIVAFVIAAFLLFTAFASHAVYAL